MTFLKELMFAERPASVSVLALARVLSMSVSRPLSPSPPLPAPLDPQPRLARNWPRTPRTFSPLRCRMELCALFFVLKADGSNVRVALVDNPQ